MRFGFNLVNNGPGRRRRSSSSAGDDLRALELLADEVLDLKEGIPR